MISLHGRTVVPGYAEGEALVTREPISGWGGIDPAQRRIIESRHELNGLCFTGKVLVFPSAKGSSGWSLFFQATRLLGTAPNPGGGRVVTYRGWPLYTFLGDAAPGDATGQAADDDGGYWYVMRPAGQIVGG